MAKKKVGYAKYRLSPLKAITAKARILYASGKYAKWTDAIKAASGKTVTKTAAKKPGVKKARIKKVAPKKKTVVKSKMFGVSSMVGSSNSNLNELKNTANRLDYIAGYIKRLRESKAGKTAIEKKKISSEILLLNQQFKKLKAYFNTLATFKR